MSTCTKPLPRPEEPNVANLPCGKPATVSFVLRGTHTRVNRCEDCYDDDWFGLTTEEVATLEHINQEQKENANG